MTGTETSESEGGTALAAPDLAARTQIECVADDIGAGSILIEEGAPLPRSVWPRAHLNASGWSAVTDQRSPFAQEVAKAGLTFFFMAGEIKATVFGFDRQKGLRAALNRLIANVKTQDCNSIEITRIAGNSFLGIPYVSV